MQRSSIIQGLKHARGMLLKKIQNKPSAGQRKFTPCPSAEVSLFLVSLGFSLEAELGSMCQRRSCQPPTRFGSGTGSSTDLSNRHDVSDIDRGGKARAFTANERRKTEVLQLNRFETCFGHWFLVGLETERWSVWSLNKKSHKKINIMIERNVSSCKETWFLSNKIQQKKVKLPLFWLLKLSCQKDCTG